jgi:hypothetical protein
MLSLGSSRSSDKPEIVRRTIVFPQRFEVTGDAISKALEDYKTAIAETVKANLDLLDELPSLKTLHTEELKEFLQKAVEDDLKRDLVFEKSVELQRYMNDMWRYVDSYFKEVFNHHANLKDQTDADIFAVSRMFFNSDLPVSFLKTIENSLLTEKDYIDIYDKRIRRERLDLLVNRNNRRKFEKICDVHNRWIDPFVSRLKNLDRTRVKIIWYVDFNNSDKIEDIFKDKAINSSRIDTHILQNAIDDLQKLTYEIGRLVEANMEFHPFASYEGTDSVRTIRRIMDLLSLEAEG